MLLILHYNHNLFFFNEIGVLRVCKRRRRKGRRRRQNKKEKEKMKGGRM